ncbi:MAG TPA: FAD-dependent oxidoreductase [Chitinophagaceae bacterium]|nr:FAD-dependent oxidoreductase [Chitinophagaceae bacterium]
MPKVIIMGGGVAGMSAAHELIERGFEVQVFERKIRLPGGKARSVPVPDQDAGVNYNPLPGEHGFRFFPGFYRHVIDTMKRIPFPGNKDGVFDNLVPAPHVMLARTGYDPIIMPDRFPRSLADLKESLTALHVNTGLTEDDKEFFADKVWQLMTSCWERRQNDYERLGWWEFTGAQGRSKAYADLLAKGLTRTLVAARAQTASTKTGGDIFLQLLFNMANPAVATDRILNGPTNDRWLHPWYEYLIGKGVDYRFLSDVVKIDCDPVAKKITGVWVQKLKESKGPFVEAVPRSQLPPPEKFTADYYLLAVPIEVAAPLLIGDILKGRTIQQFTIDIIEEAIKQNTLADPEISIMDVTNEAIANAAVMQADPCLFGVVELSNDVSWMTGVQFYLNEVVTLNQGHIIFSDSPWAVTAISQLQFWKNFDIAKYADGKVKSILSCDVSNWDVPGILDYPDGKGGMTKKTAKECTPEEIKDEVWAQMKRALVQNGKPMIDDSMIHTWFIDRDIKFEGDYASKNKEPLLVNKVDTWRLRPNSYCHILNLFFAADYVRTHTDLATMEGANEAARRAVNNIIEASGLHQPYCEIWNLHEPGILKGLRRYDERRYEKGLDWRMHETFWMKILLSIYRFIRWFLQLFQRKPRRTN